MVLVHDKDNYVGVRPNSDTIVPQLKSPVAAVIVAVNVIHLPSFQSCPSISSRSCGMASRRHEDTKAYWGCHCHQHLREGATTTTGGGRTSLLGWASGFIHCLLMPLSKIHRGANKIDRERHE
jgi:hypothetical protein